MSNDEELQRKIESGHTVDDNDVDAASYKLVFKALSKQNEIRLSQHFSETIIAKIQAKQKRAAFRDFLWLMFGVLFLIVGFITATIVAGLTFELGFLREISGYSGVFLFGAGFIFLLNWLEKRFVSKHESSSPYS